MTEADLARLSVAKRAYEATRPGEAEVLTGVRRARLALRRPRRRRSWLSKGLVFVVLAIGSLAYAKPHALGEVVERVLQLAPGGRTGHGHGPSALAQADEPSPQQAPRAAQLANGVQTPSGGAMESSGGAMESSGGAMESSGGATESGGAARAKQPSVAKAEAATIAKSAVKKTAGARATTSVDAKQASPAGDQAVSEWGRIGQALERGDEQAALAELGSLSHSDDPRTRDKADLGRAQLMLAHGNRDDACALARSLTHRSAGARIERQAQALLSSCSR